MHTLAQAIHGVDVWIYLWLSRFAGNWFLDRLARQEESDNILKGGIFLAAYWYLWFRAGADREKRRWGILVTLMAAVLALIAGRTLSYLVPFRIRPMYNPLLFHPSFSVPIAPNLENWSSFPSDAATFFFALAFGIARLSRRLAAPILLYTAVWISLPRMYLGIHFTSDIVAGAAVGIATVWLALRYEMPHTALARNLLGFESNRPQWFYAIAFFVSFEFADIFNDVRNILHAALHVARVSSVGGVLRWWFAVAGFGILALYALAAVARARRKRRAPYGPHPAGSRA